LRNGGGKSNRLARRRFDTLGLQQDHEVKTMARSLPTLQISEPEAHVVLVTVNRPEAANALNTQLGLDLIDFFEDIAMGNNPARCIVVTGAGERAFCAGGDLKERDGMSDEAWSRQHLVFERMARAIIGCPIPTIAAVNGAAYGGGCEIALACDFIYAADHARFAFPEGTLGIIPGAGGTQNLPRAIGLRRAKEMILTGAPASAQEALDWGLVNRVLAKDQLLPAALATAQRIARNAPLSMRQAKQAMSRGIDLSIWDGLAIEIEAYNRTVPTHDRREGVAAANEKRTPRFEGR
jgi:enoyl-CoA hydratase/carnithine racemase